MPQRLASVNVKCDSRGGAKAANKRSARLCGEGAIRRRAANAGGHLISIINIGIVAANALHVPPLSSIGNKRQRMRLCNGALKRIKGLGDTEPSWSDGRMPVACVYDLAWYDSACARITLARLAVTCLQRLSLSGDCPFMAWPAVF